MSYLETWNETTPAGTEDKTFGDDRIREFKRAIRERLATEHADITGGAGAALLRHLPGRCSVAFYGTTSEINSLSSPPQYALAFDTSVRSWRYYTGSTWARGDAIPSGTRMIFCQASAPTGWTQDTSLSDRVLRVVSGTGGGTGGSWIVSGLTAADHVHSIGSHTHGMSGHQHGIFIRPNGFDMDRPNIPEWGTSSTYTFTKAQIHGRDTWGDNSQLPASLSAPAEPNVTEAGGGNSGAASASVSSNGGWRPAYVDVIVCTKD